MTEERWKNLIRIEPDAADIEARSRGARQRALAEFRATHVPNRAWMLAVAAIFLALIIQVPAKAPAPIQQQTTKMELTLSDGTRVQWVFDNRFAL